jgi:diguanylate cyclase (GGDEF)-like protein
LGVFPNAQADWFDHNLPMQILLADESFVDATRLMSYLANSHEVLHALDAHIAVDMFRANRPDLLILALRIPNGSGPWIAESSRQVDSERTQHNPLLATPVVYLSDGEAREDILAAYAHGAAMVVPKNIDARLFAAQIDALTRTMATRERLIAAYLHFETVAMRDHLTQIYNRRYLDLQVDELWDVAVEHGEQLGLLMLDIDNFKKFNDLYGHGIGDICLTDVAKGMDQAVRAYNSTCPRLDCHAFAARYGGEEFSVVVPAATPEVLQQVAQSIHANVATLARPHAENCGFGRVTVSIGGACLAPAASDQISSLFRRADAALYEAKQLGRNQTVFG